VLERKREKMKMQKVQTTRTDLLEHIISL